MPKITSLFIGPNITSAIGYGFIFLYSYNCYLFNYFFRCSP